MKSQAIKTLLGHLKGYKIGINGQSNIVKSTILTHLCNGKGILMGTNIESGYKVAGAIFIAHPFIASWSLVDSLAVGVPIVASDVPTVRDICDQFEGVTYVDHRDSEKIGTACADILTAGHINGMLYGRKNIAILSFSVYQKWEADWCESDHF